MRVGKVYWNSEGGREGRREEREFLDVEVSVIESETYLGSDGGTTRGKRGRSETMR